MKKRLKFLYRYFTTSRRWRRWFNFQLLLVLFAFTVFFIALFWSEPISTQRNSTADAPALQTAPSNGLVATPTSSPTPMPPEFFTNSEQSVGIAFIAGVLVLITLIGTVLFLPQNAENKP